VDGISFLDEGSYLAAVSRKDRWWRSRGAEDSRGTWFAIGCEKRSLETAALFLRSQSADLNYKYAESPFLAAHPLVGQLGGCSQCNIWDSDAVREPIDVVVEPTNKKNHTVSKRFTDRLWVSSAGWVDCSVVKRELFEALESYVSPGVVVGDVVVRGGDQVHEMVAVSDPGAPAVRERYDQGMFNSNPTTHGWAPCHACGRLLKCGHWWSQYILSKEHDNRRVRFYKGAVLVPPEVAEACGFRDPARWPGMSVRPVPAFAEALDPMPSPTPGTWDGLEARFKDYGYELPFPKACRYDLQSAWIEAREARLGKDACLIDVSSVRGTMDCDQIAKQLYSVRMRGLFELRVGERIEGWDDQTLIQFLVDYHAATNGYGGSFPI